jgi:hypothetical protein
MLKVDVSLRISISEIFSHIWMRGDFLTKNKYSSKPLSAGTSVDNIKALAQSTNPEVPGVQTLRTRGINLNLESLDRSETGTDTAQNSGNSRKERIGSASDNLSNYFTVEGDPIGGSDAKSISARFGYEVDATNSSNGNNNNRNSNGSDIGVQKTPKAHNLAATQSSSPSDHSPTYSEKSDATFASLISSNSLREDCNIGNDLNLISNPNSNPVSNLNSNSSKDQEHSAELSFMYDKIDGQTELGSSDGFGEGQTKAKKYDQVDKEIESSQDTSRRTSRGTSRRNTLTISRTNNMLVSYVRVWG